MSLTGEKILLRVYLQSADKAPHAPTYELLVAAARKEEMAGVTVIHGILGEGYHGVTRAGGFFSLVKHVPVIVEIVDDAEKISNFVSASLSQTLMGGMATLERAAVIMYRRREDGHGESPKLLGEKPPLSTLPKIQPGSDMTINENSILLRVFIGESDSYEHKPLYEQIIQKIRELGLAGATVLRGFEGFGANSVVHRAHLLEMSTDLPIIIEIVDVEPNIKLLLPHLEEMVKEGMITMEYVMVLMYRHNPEDAPLKNTPET